MNKIKINFPLVTFMVPSYNHEEYIEDCLNSIINDEYPNKELIIIDDGSTDTSFEKIKNWIKKKDSEININFSKTVNSGICKTLNRMIEYSNGEYIRIIASDDTNINGSTKEFINAFQNDSQADCIFGDCIIIDKQGSRLYKSSLRDFYKVKTENFIKSKSALKKEIILNWSVCGPSTMYRKKVFDQVGNFDEKLIVEDWDMFLRLLKFDRVKFIPKLVANYRFHERNTSRFNNRKSRIKILKDIKQTIINNIDGQNETYINKLLKIKILHVDAKLNYLNMKFIAAIINYIHYRINKYYANI